MEQLHQALHEAQVSKGDCEAQVERLSLMNKLCNEEMKQLQGTLETLKREAQQHAEQVKEKEAVVHALRQQLKDSTEEHAKEKVKNSLCQLRWKHVLSLFFSCFASAHLHPAYHTLSFKTSLTV